jgi:hypothetical protein
MEDKQKKYLDKVIELLVKNTVIDFDRGLVSFPFINTRSLYQTNIGFFHSDSTEYILFFNLFSKYTKDTYGLSKDEVYYVWNKYRHIILDKLDND